MGHSHSAETRVRHVCARALDGLARRIDGEEPPAHAAAGPAATVPDASRYSFQYDDEMPPTVPPGERLSDWRREHGPPPRAEHRVSAALRRLARRLDGTVISRQTFG